LTMEMNKVMWVKSTWLKDYWLDFLDKDIFYWKVFQD
jgi:hypothetical protein